MERTHAAGWVTAGGTSWRAARSAEPDGADGEPLVQVRASDGTVEFRGARTARLTTGQGVGAEWTQAGSQLTVRNDALGVFPLFYAATPTSITVSPSIPALIAAGVPSTLDDDAVAVLLRLGCCVGEDTPFRAIQALPPGATLTWEPGRCSIASRWPAWPAQSLSRERAMAAFRDTFRDAVLHRLPDGARVGLPLSGGRDSRHILLALASLGRLPALAATARYYPPRASNDVPVASEVAAALGVPHTVLDQPRSQLETLRRHLHATGFCTLTPSYFVHIVGDYLAPRADVLFDGIGGDVLAAGHYLRAPQVALFRQGRLEELAGELLRGFQGCGEGLMAMALTPGARVRFPVERARARLVRELERHRDADNPMRSFLLLNRTRRDIGLMPTRCYPAAGRVECPFLDPEVVQVLMGIPDEQLLDHAFHHDTIAASYPRWGGLPYVQRAAERHDSTHYRRLALELLGLRPHLASAEGLRGTALLARLARCLVDPRYSATAGWLAPLVTWMSEMSRL